MGNERVTDSIYQIDACTFKLLNFTSAYLIVGKELALIESGPAKSAPFVIEGIKEFGFDPCDITYIIITHIHLDHGGGAGTLLKDMPQAKVVAHEKGVKHLIDPTKLVNSSKRVFGDLINEWYGEVLPVEQNRVMPVKDGDVIDLGKGQRLRMIDSPGHANHHICIYSEASKGLFTGDTAGVYFKDFNTVIPTTPPPEFDPDINIKTMNDLMKLDLNLLLFSHFGSTSNVDETLNKSIGLLKKWKDSIFEIKKEDVTMDRVIEKFREYTNELLDSTNKEDDLYKWIISHHIPMCAAGYLHYFNKKST